MFDRAGLDRVWLLAVNRTPPSLAGLAGTSGLRALIEHDRIPLVVHLARRLQRRFRVEIVIPPAERAALGPQLPPEVTVLELPAQAPPPLFGLDDLLQREAPKGAFAMVLGELATLDPASLSRLLERARSEQIPVVAAVPAERVPDRARVQSHSFSEGRMTAGFAVATDDGAELARLLPRLRAASKDPLGAARQLGFIFMGRLAAGWVSLSELGEAAATVIGRRVAFEQVEDPGLAMKLDHPDQLAIVRERLQRQA